MFLSGEDKEGRVHSSNAAPTPLELLGRMRSHRDLQRIESSARRRIGAQIPSGAEIEAVFVARKAAESLQREENLQRDRHRRGVDQLHYYDTSMAAETDDVFQDAPLLSDVEARRAVLGPLKKLVAILAARQRFACLLRFASGVGEVETAQTDQRSLGFTVQSTLPSASLCPNMSTLIRGITLPDVKALGCSAHARETDLSYNFVEEPRARPWHEPFGFRLKHFTPVAMPEFALDVASQADKEVPRGEGEGLPSQEGGDIPMLITTQPLETAMSSRRSPMLPTTAQPSKDTTLVCFPDGAHATG